jgi:hypothetical protein
MPDQHVALAPDLIATKSQRNHSASTVSRRELTDLAGGFDVLRHAFDRSARGIALSSRLAGVVRVEAGDG